MSLHEEIGRRILAVRSDRDGNVVKKKRLDTALSAVNAKLKGLLPRSEFKELSEKRQELVAEKNAVDSKLLEMKRTLDGLYLQRDRAEKELAGSGIGEGSKTIALAYALIIRKFLRSDVSFSLHEKALLGKMESVYQSVSKQEVEVAKAAARREVELASEKWLIDDNGHPRVRERLIAELDR